MDSAGTSQRKLHPPGKVTSSPPLFHEPESASRPIDIIHPCEESLRGQRTILWKEGTSSVCFVVVVVVLFVFITGSYIV